MRVLHIHLLNDGRFVDISFWYPLELADNVEAEIFPIVESMRQSQATQGMDMAPAGQALRHRRDQLPRLLDELPRHVPAGMALTSVRQEGGQIALVGLAVSNAAVATLMRSLEKSTFFGQPDLKGVKAVAAAGRHLNEFTLLISPHAWPEPSTAADGNPCSVLPSMLGQQSEVNNLLIEINMSGLGKGIEFELFRPVQEREYGSYAILPIEVQLKGSYRDLRHFVHELGTLPGLLIADEFSLAGGKDETLSLRAVINVHRLLGSPASNRATPRTECPAGVGNNAIDPFSQSRLARPDAPRSRPDPDRPRSPLEAYPLESLHFIGMLEVNRRPIAVVQSEKGVHQIKTGDYLGLHSGLVTSVTESEIALRELVPDGNGGYVERTSTLPRQEGRR